MKKIAKYIFTILLIFSFSACDDYLKEERYTDVGYDYFKTKVGMEAAVTSVYQAMRWYAGSYNQASNSTSGGNMEAYFCLTEYGTDFTWEGTDGGNKDPFNKYLGTLNPQQDVINKFWNNNYKGITRANTALMYMKDVPDMTDVQKTQRIAELKFLRAFYYFDLVQHYGALPLVTEGNVTQVITDFKRAPVANVYKQIISDLRASIAVLPDVYQQTDRGRATKWSASHLLAKVYLTRISTDAAVRGGKLTDLDSAVVYSESVINSGKFALESNFANVFEQNNQKVTKEIIWDVEYTKDALFSGAGSSTSDGGNQLHLYWVTQYDVKPGMIRDMPNGRPFKRMRANPKIITSLWDRKVDSRVYKTFKWTFYSNNPGTATKWVKEYYYINPATNAEDKTDVIYTTPAELVGKPKFKAGDTAIYISSKFYGGLTDYSTTYPKQALLDKAKYRQMLIDIAKAPYLYIPVDKYDTNNFPAMLKWLDDQRPDINFQAGSRNFHRMRLAETYLIAAEAYGRKGDFVNAVKYINVVRTRAAYAEGEAKPQQVYKIDGGVKNTASTVSSMLVTEAMVKAPVLPSGAGFDPFVDWMLEERGRELYGELNRWEDLVRTGTLFARAKLYNPDAAGSIKDYHKLRPIPNTYADRLLPVPPVAEVQNPGYY
ncbi:MAG: RagB/SusD family nutrient uptake outer membrane protein [Bacteroidota bacterium]|nr:RagB/SusD family nutrient uptake outer membrane protein [Odoribacter sp.]MDP3644599.1 RagB/SusD family nutrient uptake outer membrane protein [Bacteroidota bacterium]